MTEDNKLNDIKEILDNIHGILLIAFSSEIEKAIKEFLREDTQQKKIYLLCEHKTTEEIAAALKKTTGDIRKQISELRKKGFVKTVEKDGKFYHVHRF